MCWGCNLGHFQQKPYRSPIHPKLPTCSFLQCKASEILEGISAQGKNGLRIWIAAFRALQFKQDIKRAHFAECADQHSNIIDSGHESPNLKKTYFG